MIDCVVAPESLVDRDVRFVDARGGPAGAAAYASGHLRGAVHADLDRDLSGPVADASEGGRHPLPDPQRFAHTLGRWGIGPSTEVVAYDDHGGANAASRFWWMLRAFGHERVAVLDGGYAAGVAAGIEVQLEPPHVEALPPYPASRFELPTSSIEEVAERARDSSWMVLDVRAAERWRGDVEPLDPVAGHVPGARNLFFGENLDAAGRFLPPEELASRYRALLGDLPSDRLVVSCGSGVTACHTLLALERAGLAGASLYVGSWSQWCRSGRPIGKGDDD